LVSIGYDSQIYFYDYKNTSVQNKIDFHNIYMISIIETKNGVIMCGETGEIYKLIF